MTRKITYTDAQLKKMGVRKTTIRDLKVNDFFTLSPIAEPTNSRVYVRDSYDRSTKKYDCYKFENNDYRQFKGDKEVYVDFYF